MKFGVYMYLISPSICRLVYMYWKFGKIYTYSCGTIVIGSLIGICRLNVTNSNIVCIYIERAHK